MNAKKILSAIWFSFALVFLTSIEPVENSHLWLIFPILGNFLAAALFARHTFKTTRP